MAAAVYNVQRDPKKHPEPISPFAFFPDHEQQQATATKSTAEVGSVFRLLYSLSKVAKQQQ